MMFLGAALHVVLSLHRFRSSISTIDKARWGSVGHHWLVVFFISLVLGSVELGNFVLCFFGIIYCCFVAFRVWIMGVFGSGCSLSVWYLIVLPSVCWALLIVCFVVVCVIVLSSIQWHWVG
jgi:hypothetical protein